MCHNYCLVEVQALFRYDDLTVSHGYTVHFEYTRVEKKSCWGLHRMGIERIKYNRLGKYGLHLG
jgi:hypothetical protein